MFLYNGNVINGFIRKCIRFFFNFKICQWLLIMCGKHRTFVWLALSEPAKSIMNSLPWRTAVAVLDALLTVTLSNAWLLEDVLFTPVGSTVLCRLPWCSSPITSSMDTTVTSDSPVTWMFRFLDVSSRSSRKPDVGFKRSRIFSLYISKYDIFTCEHTILLLLLLLFIYSQTIFFFFLNITALNKS